MCLQCRGGIVWRRVAPQLVDQTAGGDDLVRAQQQQRENGSLLHTAEVKGGLAVSDLERPKDPEVQHPRRTYHGISADRSVARQLSAGCQASACVLRPDCSTVGACNR